MRHLAAHWRFAITLLSAVLMLGTSNIQLWAQLAQPLKEVDQSTKLHYRVIELPESAKTGDYVWLEAELRNDGTQPVDVYWDEGGSSTIFQFTFIHEATGRVVPLSFDGQPRTPRHEVAKITQYRSIAPGFTLWSRFQIGKKQPFTGVFREPGRYVIHSSLVILQNKVVDERTGKEQEMKTAWTGTIHAKPLVIEVPAADDQVTGDGEIVGTVVSADNQPINGALVRLFAARRGENLDEDRTNDWFDGRIFDQSLSSDGGRFDFASLPNDADFLLVANHPSHGQQSKRFSFKEFMRREHPVIKFTKRITIRGKVLDSQGMPVSDVRVNEYGTESANSAEDGSFQCLAVEKSDDQPYRIDLWKQGWLSTHAEANLQMATSGEWTIVMQTEKRMTIRGRAIFSDETPLANMPLQVELAPIRSQIDENQVPAAVPLPRIHARTDLDGFFSFVTPNMGEFKGIITASHPQIDQGGERRWNVEVPKLSNGQHPLELKFENRGQIIVAIFGTTGLPESLEPVISLHSTQHHYNLEWQRIHVRTLGEVREYNGLAPGEYELSVDIPNSGIQRQSVKVVVPNSEPFSATGKIQFPKTVFGSVQGKFTMPDGSSPASHLEIGVFGPNDYHHSLKTDLDGGFHLDLLPIGDYRIAYPPTLFSVKNEVPIDLGTVRLKALEEKVGWFDGKIAYEGGATVGGVFVMQRNENDLTASLFSYGNIANPSLKPSGDFHLQLPQGNRDLVFYLHGDKRSPIHRGASFDVGREIMHKLIVNVDIEAGSTITRDLQVPLRQRCRDITVGWVGMNEPQFSVLSAWNDKTRWIYSSWNNSYKLDAAGNRIMQGDFTITGFPTVPRPCSCSGSLRRKSLCD